jgi:hypothetical protein
MTRKLDRHARMTGKLGKERGERYALIPREVMESTAYHALPPFAVVVLVALAVQCYHNSRNGSLALPWEEARSLGVRNQAHLYSGLQLLQAVQLIVCTRRGHLTAGRRLASLFALTWRQVAEPPSGVAYDAGISMSLSPSNAWAQWAKPDNWTDQVKIITRRAKGKASHVSPFPAKSVSPRGERSTHPVGSATPPNRSPRRERRDAISTHPVVVTSEIWGGGSVPTDQEDGHGV